MTTIETIVFLYVCFAAGVLLSLLMGGLTVDALKFRWFTLTGVPARVVLLLMMSLAWPWGLWFGFRVRQKARENAS